MRPDGDQAAWPIWRDWSGWLFVLLAAAAIALVLYASGRNSERALTARPHPVAPPADVVPDVLADPAAIYHEEIAPSLDAAS